MSEDQVADVAVVDPPVEVEKKKPKKPKNVAPQEPHQEEAPPVSGSAPVSQVDTDSAQVSETADEEETVIVGEDSEDIHSQAGQLFSMLSDATRIQIVMLCDGVKTVKELCNLVNQSQPAVSHHLALLKYARIILPHRTGKSSQYRVTTRGRMLINVINMVEDSLVT
jgi:ArsR family transcriptional regulator, zinc-responsive transcriptional repressor